MPTGVTSKRRTAAKRNLESSGASVLSAQEQIARRAYEMFLNRGGDHGHDLEDWLKAERELNGQALQQES